MFVLKRVTLRRMSSLLGQSWELRSMKFKLGQVKDAIDALRNKARLHDVPNHELTITLREENPGSGILGECLVINTTVITKANQYDDYKGDVTTEYTLEVFSDSENRPTRYTAVETRELTKG